MPNEPDRRGHCVCGHLGWIHHPATLTCHRCECTKYQKCECRR